MLKRFVKRLLSCLLLAALFVLVVIGGTLGVQGWRLYRATAAQKPIAGLYDEISSRPGFASCDQLPQTYIDAVISVEDSRFERHHGIDPAAIVRALWADLRTRSLAEGGSTLTQQLAKNELFTQEKQMARKAAEMFAARDIEDYYSKQQIFEMYAGSCYFGNQWCGVAQAAQQTHPGVDPRRVCGTGRPAQCAFGLRRQRGAGPQARARGGGADGARQKADPHPGTGAPG